MKARITHFSRYCEQKREMIDLTCGCRGFIHHRKEGMGERTAQILAKSACSDFVKSGSRERTGCELRLLILKSGS